MGDEREDQARPEAVGTDSLSRRQRDSFDLNNESAGLQTGRAQRFAGIQHLGEVNAKERDKEKAFNELLRRLQDPAYARLYASAVKAVERAGDAVTAALASNDREARAIAERLEDMRAGAAKLADGRRVFRASDGRLMAEDGTDVSDQRASVTGLSQDTPSWEDYERAKEREDALRREREELERYQREVIEPAKDRLEDTENPPSEEELEFFSEIEKTLPPRAKAEFERTQAAEAPAAKTAAEEYTQTAALNAPDVGGQFGAARNGAAAVQPGVTPQPDPMPKAVV